MRNCLKTHIVLTQPVIPRLVLQSIGIRPSPNQFIEVHLQWSTTRVISGHILSALSIVLFWFTICERTLRPFLWVKTEVVSGPIGIRNPTASSASPM